MNEKIDQLAALQRSGDLSTQDAAELDNLLRHDVQARKRYVAHLLLEHDLREMDELPSEKDSLPSRLVLASLIGLAAAITLGTILLWPKSPPQIPIVETSATEDHFISSVAVVRRASNLADDAIELCQGKVIQPGTIELTSGLLHLDLHNGVSLVVEAPALFEIVSPDLVKLAHGKLRAQVPPPAQGFRIDTESFDVVDLGTEFAVSVSPHGGGELHVIDGEVELYEKSPGNGAAQLLTAGHGMSLDHQGKRSNFTANPTRFADSNTMRENELRQRRRWQKSFDLLAADPDTVALYDFQSVNGRLPNLATHAAKDSEGIVVGCSLAEGRWSDKSALAFGNPSHRVRIKIPGTFDTLTFAAWVKVESLSLIAVPLIQSERTPARSISWDLRNHGKKTIFKAFFGDQNGAGDAKEDRHRYLSDSIAISESQIATWMHFAVTIDNHNRQIIHYTNGIETFRHSIEDPNPLSIGVADLGNWPSRDWAKGTKWEIRHLIGSMGEFLISKRALTTKDIRRLYAAGRPE